MTIQRMVELLEIEHECILRAGHDDCDRNCADCDLVQDDLELHEMYTDVIALLKEQETEDTGSCRVFQCKKCGFGIEDIFANDEFKYPIDPRYCPNCGRKVKWDD